MSGDILDDESIFRPSSLNIRQTVDRRYSADQSVDSCFSCYSSVVSSPVSDLALNLEVLSTDGSSQCSGSSRCRLARRRLSLVTSVTSASSTQRSVDDGFVDSAGNSPQIDSPFSQPVDSCASWQHRPPAFKRFQSIPFNGFEPTPPNVRCGVSRVTRSDCDLTRSGQRDVTEDQVDRCGGSHNVAAVPRRVLADETNVYRGSCKSQNNLRRSSHVQLTARAALHRSASCCTRQLESEDDPEFLGDLKSPSPSSSSISLFPRHLEGLFFSPVLEASENIVPGSEEYNQNISTITMAPPTSSVSVTTGSNLGSTVRGLFRSPSAPLSGRPRPGRLFSGDCAVRRRNSQKRSESDRETDDGGNPVETKRQRSSNSASVNDGQQSTDTDARPRRPRPFVRCHSETELLIKSALSRTDTHPDLIGDFSKPYVLPLISGKHPDLKAISADTMARLLRREFNDFVSSFVVVDCRFPYEYVGGHIQGAKNIYTHDELLTEFFTSPPPICRLTPGGVSDKRDVLIFHCEFSSERGPNLSRFLRRKDRDFNDYPSLFYPEVYLLEGGFKSFYESNPELCFPSGYTPMLHIDHTADLKYFRAKTLSWISEKGRSGTGTCVRPAPQVLAGQRPLTGLGQCGSDRSAGVCSSRVALKHRLVQSQSFDCSPALTH